VSTEMRCPHQRSTVGHAQVGVTQERLQLGVSRALLQVIDVRRGDPASSTGVQAGHHPVDHLLLIEWVELDATEVHPFLDSWAGPDGRRMHSGIMLR